LRDGRRGPNVCHHNFSTNKRIKINPKQNYLGFNMGRGQTEEIWKQKRTRIQQEINNKERMDVRVGAEKQRMLSQVKGTESLVPQQEIKKQSYFCKGREPEGNGGTPPQQKRRTKDEKE
jgi:hypothetical protein